MKYTIGIDYGTDSVRTLIVDTANGKEIASSVFEYPRWKAGKYCNPKLNQFRQHPLDYIEGLEFTVKDAVSKLSKGSAENIVAISIDTTGSTPVPVDEKGSPLSLLPEYMDNPNAMFVLWKDHTAIREADEINALSKSWGGVDYTKYEGGVYSSEWFWAKLLHVIREDEKIRQNAFSWVEHCDWMPALLSGNTNPLSMKRSRCAAGHKAMWHEDFDGLPSEEFLVKLDPMLKGLRQRLYKDTYTCDVIVGNLTSEWAKRLNLSEKVLVGAGAFDAHIGAIGGGVKPYYLFKIMGTSTCDMLIAPINEMKGKLVKGICGQVDGSIIPAMLGLEAGQSAFGDVYAWFKDLLLFPFETIVNDSKIIDKKSKEKLLEEIENNIIPELSRQAEKIPIEETSVLAIDWLNGRRTPFANQALKGAITGLTLGTHAPAIFRALVEATAFGSKSIIDRFKEEGVPINGVIALGGVAKKSPFIMQIVADVLNVGIKVVRSEQACALGAAMAAAVVGKVYNSIFEAQDSMNSSIEKEYIPNQKNALLYQQIYERYKTLGSFIESSLVH